MALSIVLCTSHSLHCLSLLMKMMGDLATTHGFYSADWDDKTYGVGSAMGEGGEALTVTDPEEAWMFHIVRPLF